MRNIKQPKKKKDLSVPQGIVLTSAQKSLRDRVIRHYYPILYQRALTLTKDRQGAASSATDTLEKYAYYFVTDLPEDDIGSKDLEAWLMMNVHYRSIDHLRQTKTKKFSMNRASQREIFWDHSIVVALEDGDDGVWLKEYEMLDSAIKMHLSPTRQKIFYLATVQGLKHRDIAAELNMTINSVKTTAADSKRILRKTLSQYADKLSRE